MYNANWRTMVEECLQRYKSSLNLNVAKSLKKIRLHNDLSQEKMAQVCGTCILTYNRWETARTDFKLSQIGKIAKLFKVEPEDLINGLK